MSLVSNRELLQSDHNALIRSFKCSYKNNTNLYLPLSSLYFFFIFQKKRYEKFSKAFLKLGYHEILYCNSSDTTHKTKEIYTEFIAGLVYMITKAEVHNMPPHSSTFWSNIKGLRTTGGWRQ